MKVEKKIRKRLRKKRQKGTGGRRKVRQRKKILVMMTLRDKFIERHEIIQHKKLRFNLCFQYYKFSRNNKNENFEKIFQSTSRNLLSTAGGAQRAI